VVPADVLPLDVLPAVVFGALCGPGGAELDGVVVAPAPCVWFEPPEEAPEEDGGVGLLVDVVVEPPVVFGVLSTGAAALTPPVPAAATPPLEYCFALVGVLLDDFVPACAPVTPFDEACDPASVPESARDDGRSIADADTVPAV
jgi:hypothetical protein